MTPRTCISQLSQLFDKAITKIHTHIAKDTATAPKLTLTLEECLQQSRNFVNGFVKDMQALQAARAQQPNHAIEVDAFRYPDEGESWSLRASGVDGWDVGWEKETRCFVKRKGRGAFKSEVEAEEVGIGSEEGEGIGKVELADGFEYWGWIDGEMERTRSGADVKRQVCGECGAEGTKGHTGPGLGV